METLNQWVPLAFPGTRSVDVPVPFPNESSLHSRCGPPLLATKEDPWVRAGRP